MKGLNHLHKKCVRSQSQKTQSTTDASNTRTAVGVMFEEGNPAVRLNIQVENEETDSSVPFRVKVEPIFSSSCFCLNSNGFYLEKHCYGNL